jgi:uncharacterized membrane protein
VNADAVYDLGTGVLCFAVLAVYHVFLRYMLRHNPRYSLAATNRHARSMWVAQIMDSGDHILAVQTLRNSTMAAIFMASTAVLLVIGVLNLAVQSNPASPVWHVFSVFHDVSQETWLIKLLALVLALLAVFFCFTMAIRLYNHVGYLIQLPKDSPDAMSSAGVARVLNQAGTYFTSGMRSYYFSMPALFWLFGPQFALAATVVLVAVLWRVDRAPS